MKAIIMAGGEGSRLRPLTCDCPKPMMRLMDRPVMQYALELLRAHGIKQIAATLGYLPDAIIDYFGDGSAFDVSLHYYVEEMPLGTAGGVKQAQDFLDETFIVLSGDGITDLNIAAALDFHRRKGSLATLVLRREVNPLEYGVVTTDSDGKIRAFYEKPARCDAVSDTVNTGIYIFEPQALSFIPDDCAYDFGHDLFPALVQAGEPVYGYVTDDYWCDIGDVRAYLSAHRAAMEGQIRLNGLSGCNGAVVLPGAHVDPTAILEAPCLIAQGAQVSAGARIGAYSVLGENAFAGKNADLKRSILWTGARAEDGAQLRGAILASGASIAPHAQAYEESVLGTGARMESRSVILPGIKLWPGKTIGAGEKLDANRVWGNRASDGFRDGSIPIPTPDRAARAAQSCMAVLNPCDLLLGRDDTPVSSALWHAAAAGAMAQGITVIDAGVCALPQLRFAQSLLRAQAAALIQEGQIVLLNDRSAPLSAKQRRSIDALLARHDYAPPFSAPTQSMQSSMHSESAYIAQAAASFRADPAAAPKILLNVESPFIRMLAEKALTRIGIKYETDAKSEKADPFRSTELESLLAREAFGIKGAFARENNIAASNAEKAQAESRSIRDNSTPIVQAEPRADRAIQEDHAPNTQADSYTGTREQSAPNVQTKSHADRAIQEDHAPNTQADPYTGIREQSAPNVQTKSRADRAIQEDHAPNVQADSYTGTREQSAPNVQTKSRADRDVRIKNATNGNHAEFAPDHESPSLNFPNGNYKSSAAFGESEAKTRTPFSDSQAHETVNNSDNATSRAELLSAARELFSRPAVNGSGEFGSSLGGLETQPQPPFSDSTTVENAECAVPFLRVIIDNRGENASFADASGAFTEAEIHLLRAWIALESGERELLLPVSATRAIDDLARRYDARTTFVSGERAVWLNLLAEQSPLQFALWTDGICFAIRAISALTDFGIPQWRSAMPRISRTNRRVAIPTERAGSVLRAFAESEPSAEFGGGVRFRHGRDWAWVCPDEFLPEFRVVTESASAESAEELCDFCIDTLNRLAHQPEK